MSEETLRIVSLNGLLGYGYPRESLQRALAMQPDLLGVDAGSTDPGPYYLGAGESFVSDAQVRSDLEPALCAAVAHGLPLIVGTAGGSGGAPHLEGLLAIVREIAARRGLRFRMAVIPAEVPQATVLEALREGRVTSCGPAHGLTEEHVRASSRIVGQMGTEPLIEALEGGAQVVIAGRSCDAGIFAAEPIRRGFAPGLALHMGKILECGTLAARPAGRITRSSARSAATGSRSSLRTPRSAAPPSRSPRTRSTSSPTRTASTSLRGWWTSPAASSSRQASARCGSRVLGWCLRRSRP